MTPIAPLITAFLREHMPIERGYSPHTCETYAHAFRLLFVFASDRLGQRPSQLCLEQIDAALVLNFLTHIEQQRGNDATTRNSRLAAIKAFTRYVEFRVPSALEQVRQIHAIPTKRHDQALVQYLTMGEVRAVLDAPNLSTRLGIRDRAMLHPASPADCASPNWSGSHWRKSLYTGHRASVSTGRAARSAPSHFGKRQPLISEPGWRYANPSVSQSSSSTPKAPR
jgi:hypothetical protein